ncbi:MAG: GNAT family N-acetyltransferase [Armatimonadetes bacterium]|nr:GNAT family N-acetyltransferase [Armatimonadota bacterium]
MADSLTERRAIELNATEMADVVTRCFEGYIMPFRLDAPTFERRFRPEGLDSQASILLFDGDAPAGVCLIARQGWTSRVAAMAIAPDFRSQGVGKRLMQRVIQEAKDRKDRRLVLEVIEQNPPAIGLYESVGFAKTRRLVGYRRGAQSGSPFELREIDPAEVVRLQSVECSTDLPWDFRPETLTLKTNTVGISLDDQAYALITETPERVVLWSVFARRDHRQAGRGRTIVEAIAARNPGASLMTPVALPDDHFSEFFAALGFEHHPISQFEMELKF